VIGDEAGDVGHHQLLGGGKIGKSKKRTAHFGVISN
jgi:hypothetical protein